MTLACGPVIVPDNKVLVKPGDTVQGYVRLERVGLECVCLFLLSENQEFGIRLIM